MVTRLEKLEQGNGGLQSRLSKLEQENGDLRSRLSKLEPPSDHYDVHFQSRAKDIYFIVSVYMDNLPALDTLRRCLVKQEDVTALTLLPAVQGNDVEWTGPDTYRRTGLLEGVVEHPCTAHQLAAAIWLNWKDFLVPESGRCRLVECQPQFWARCAREQEGSEQWSTNHHDARAYLYGAAQDEVVFQSSAVNEAAQAAIASNVAFF